MCNRLFTITGRVIHGNHLGRQLGYPTANLEVEGITGYYHLRGIYAVRVLWKDRMYNGIASMGFRPVLEHSDFTIEVYLFHFSGELYGEILTLDFIKKIRDEMKFPSLAKLVEQIERDIPVAEKILSEFGKPDSNPG
jgi:riboflavin kinase/FMN adenylyltransferase